MGEKPMANVLIVRYGEISLKGMNRSYFEDQLVKSIKNALWRLGPFSIAKRDQLIFIELGDADPEPVLERVIRVFGVVSASIAVATDPDMESIFRTALETVAEYRKKHRAQSFKVLSRRSEKRFPLTSPQISAKVGEYLLTHIPDLTVDVHQPDITVHVEVRQQAAYIYLEKVAGFGGMPYGTNGKALLLLSGGIDSPVAGWSMAKRGVAIEALHFHSYPFTSERAKEKVIELAQILSGYCKGILTLHIVNLLAVQQTLKTECDEEYFTILTRRFMMFIAERIARQNECLALITGESIGQVASQTMESLHATDAAVALPVFRPLIATDKVDIMQQAEKIGTYETSIQPYEDCCTVFLPKRPATKPRLEKIMKLESVLDREALITQALETLETLKIMPNRIL
jgi:thiamine biosynthesis protein ThiI